MAMQKPLNGQECIFHNSKQQKSFNDPKLEGSTVHFP